MLRGAFSDKSRNIAESSSSINDCTAPDSVSPVTTYPLAGVAVAASSSPTLLTLEAVSSATAGLYKCEVSGGPPRWRRVREVKLSKIHFP